MEYAQVCSTDEDILCLKLHPLQVRLGSFFYLSFLNFFFIFFALMQHSCLCGCLNQGWLFHWQATLASKFD